MRASTLTLADAVFPRSGVLQQDLLRDLGLVLGFTILMTLLAQVRVPLPFTPVPITGQTLGVLLTGAALGSRRGAATMALYLILGGVGAPVFAGWGSGLVWTLASGGYIIGFIPAAFIVGWLAERGWDRRPWVLAAMLLGNAAIYVPGLLQLAYFVPEGKVLEFGLWPFIPGDLVKLYLASLLLPVAWSVVPRLIPRK
ncbi:MAG: biotin transporter BioY [Chloroflexi bacterium]|nr:biotin transporter BioY [Chloroflexota bacterium]